MFLILAAWLYLAAHATIGTASAPPAAPTCTTDSECGCSTDCLDPK